MRWSTAVLAAAVILAGPVPVASATVGQGLVPAGDVAANTVPRPPEDSGTGTPVVRTLFASPTGNVKCRRVSYTGGVWLECLLVRTSELVRYSSESTSTGYPKLKITKATAAQRQRFASATRIPYERLVQLGPVTPPYPTCIADPNLGLSCRTGFDDSIGDQIFFGLAGSIWNCPSGEYIPGEPVPDSAKRCLVVRP